MEVHFTPEQEAQLVQIAIAEGSDPERLVKREFIDEEEMDALLERILRS